MDEKSEKYLSGYIKVTEKIKKALIDILIDIIYRVMYVHGILIGKIFALTGVMNVDTQELKLELYFMEVKVSL